MNRLVSIITPCYNGENFISRFLNSILNQTYNNIELIIINDGSTDNTRIILESYKEIFINRNVEYIIINQENKGQSEAINQGLKIFSGDYLTWPDSDDILLPNNISSKVAFLENNPEYGLVMGKVGIVNENDLDRRIKILKRKEPIWNDTLFEDLIQDKNVYYTPGGYMVRSSCFLDVNPLRSILPLREIGQNYHMLLPITYKYKCGYLNECIYLYVKRKNSHSHAKRTYEESINVISFEKYALEKIIESLNIQNEKYYLKIIIKKYHHRLLKLAFKNNKQDEFKKQFNILKRMGALTLTDIYLKYRENTLLKLLRHAKKRFRYGRHT
ncbi:glycosyltransferase family A protein [Treponema primitia]|uniref:glycosyltransferase family A protein n=1 Tax=Treponema primitia TaxID=88058 RepID=UPI0002555568|nr:glycosyltransferase family 2 protein [Treponema primitia]